MILKRFRRRLAEKISPPQHMHVETDGRGYPVLDDAMNTVLHRGKADECLICKRRKGTT